MRSVLMLGIGSSSCIECPDHHWIADMTTSHRKYIEEHGRPSDELVQEIVSRIVEVADPDRIILFGSGSRGDMGKHSDLDFLVIKSGEYNRRELTGQVYRRMRGLGHPVDIVVSTPESVDRYKEFKPMIYYPALTEGREVYVRATTPVW